MHLISPRLYEDNDMKLKTENWRTTAAFVMPGIVMIDRDSGLGYIKLTSINHCSRSNAFHQEMFLEGIWAKMGNEWNNYLILLFRFKNDAMRAHMRLLVRINKILPTYTQDHEYVIDCAGSHAIHTSALVVVVVAMATRLLVYMIVIVHIFK